MSFYADSDYPVGAELDGAHAAQFANFARAGTWGTAAQRLAVISEARQAGIDAGLLEAPDEPGAMPDAELPQAVCDVIRTLAVDCPDFDQDTYQAARDAGLSDPEFTELVAIVSFVVNLDVFARGIGVPLRPLSRQTSASSHSSGLSRSRRVRHCSTVGTAGCDLTEVQ